MTTTRTAGKRTLAPRRPIPGWLLPILWLVVTGVVMAFPFIGINNYVIRLTLLVALSAMLVSGLNLSLGWAGELNMGLPAMYAAAAYFAAWFGTNILNDLLLNMLLGLAAAVVVGLLAGAPGLRLGGWMLAVCTFLLVELVPVTLQVIPTGILGGQSGFIGIPRAQIFGIEVPNVWFFVMTIAVCSLWFIVYRNAVKSPFGNSLLVLQHGSVLAPSLGLSRYRLKLATYAFAAIPVGIAGALFAYNDRFISPGSFGITLIMYTLVASIVAGRRSIYAIFIGVIFVQFIQTFSSTFGEWGDVAFGAFLLIGGLAFGSGLAGLAARIARRLRLRTAEQAKSYAPEGEGLEIPPLAGRDLRLEAVGKTFGGAQAVKEVSLTAKAGQITALIGPNGSGKTTTLNLISGLLKPTTGRVLLGDEDLTPQSAVQVARLGVARTFQTPAVPIELSVLDAVASSRIQAHHVSLLSTILRTPRYRRIVRENREAAARWLEILGLGSAAAEPAASMALGTRRMIELARALSSDPSVILLDEVASGLDRDEVSELATVLRRVRDAGAAVILVEHNFSLVQSLADHVVVLADGAVLTDGPPKLVAEHPEVLQRFLGSGAAVSGTTIGTQSPVATAVEKEGDPR
ncbi:MAG: ATP-binding cassette domain-containing protein [Microbacterium sp.]